MLHGVNGCSLKLKGTVSRLCAPRATFVFSSKDNRIVLLTRQDFLSYHTADGVLLFIFSSNVLHFRRSLSSSLKFDWRDEDSSRFYRQQGRLATRNLVLLGLKTAFLVWNSCQRSIDSSSVIFSLICSRSSLKRLKDIDKNAISTLWIIAKVSQNYIMISSH